MTASSPTLVAAPKPAPSQNAKHDWREELHAKLVELNMLFTADALEHSEVSEAEGEIRFVTPEEFRLSMNEKDIQKAVQQVAGRPMRISIKFGDPAAPSQAAVGRPIEKKLDDVSERALSHPEVRRFQEIFPDSQVRAVRNLKE